MVTTNFNSKFSTRQERLRAYLAVHGPTFTELAGRLNVSKVRARNIVHFADRVQKRTLEIMVEAGIPVELLPGLAERVKATAAQAPSE